MMMDDGDGDDDDDDDDDEQGDTWTRVMMIRRRIVTKWYI